MWYATTPPLRAPLQGRGIFVARNYIVTLTLSLTLTLSQRERGEVVRERGEVVRERWSEERGERQDRRGRGIFERLLF